MDEPIDRSRIRFPDRNELANVIRWNLQPRIKILVVTDGIIDLANGIPVPPDTRDSGFGLRKVKAAIESDEFYRFTSFRMTGVTRDLIGDDTVLQARGLAKDQYTFTYVDDPGVPPTDVPIHDLSRYDQVWLFGFWPGNILNNASDDQISQEQYHPLSDFEIDALLRYMNNGYGVLAMGDHHFIGASLACKVPRVRTMRKWTIADGVPPIDGADRLDTNQPNDDRFGTNMGFHNIPSGAQSDNVPQPIELAKRIRYTGYFNGIFFTRHEAHVIFSGQSGEITVLPDHNHEGETRGHIYGRDETEWLGDLLMDELSSTDFPDGLDGLSRPIPEVIAIGHPRQEPGHVKNSFGQIQNTTRPFGLVTVYDGERAGIGRVVTDSTWHHWFNLNLQFTEPYVNSSGQVVSPGMEAVDHYRAIRNYHKNVALWLSPASKRDQMMLSAAWGVVVRAFDGMRLTPGDSLWKLGTSGLELLHSEATPSLIREWVQSLLPRKLQAYMNELDSISIKKNPGMPKALDREEVHPNYGSYPAIALAEIFIVGGIIKQFVPLVEKYMLYQPYERKQLDVKEISEAFVKGCTLGCNQFKTYTQTALQQVNERVKTISKGLRIEKKPADFLVPLVRQKLSITLRTVVFNNPLYTLQITRENHYLEAEVTASLLRVIKKPVRLPESGILQPEYLKNTPVWYMDMNKTLCTSTFEEGEEVTIELYLIGEKSGNRESVYRKTFSGNPLTWIGVSKADSKKVDPNGYYVDAWIEIQSVK